MTFKNIDRYWPNTLWVERLAAVFASLWFLLSIMASLQKLAQGQATPIVVLGELANIAFLVFLLVLIWLRRPPVLKAAGLWPRMSGLVTFILPVLALYIPKAEASTLRSGIAAGLVLAGILAALVCLAYLGRSFSILPQARALVTQGPYRLCRHPLYVAEMLVIIGGLLPYQMPLALALMLAIAAVQLWRMHYEEQVLRAAFPDYAAYAARTARLLPGLY